ncbi:hypothetical protein, partial [Streptomyces sp. NPDC056405]|uniref:hypothetical protein n=1 Tax=Streptomyces sp. NPDC056405 TaxID=3345811 RepID=UPI0035E0AC88
MTDGISTGYDVAECNGSLTAPATDTDDSKDWGWTPQTPAAPGEPVRVGETLASMSEAFRAVGERARQAQFTLNTDRLAAARIDPDTVRQVMQADLEQPSADAPSQAERRRRQRDAAGRLREALEPVLTECTGEAQHVRVVPEPDGHRNAVLRGRAEPCGLRLAVRVTHAALSEPVAMDVFIQRCVTEARAQLERRCRPASDAFARGTTPVRVEVDGVDFTGMVT